MTETEVIQVLKQHFENLFPKVCPNCKHRYPTLREYILATERIGPPTSFDAALGDWKAKQFIGSVVLANCPCGSTLALSTEGMMHSQQQALLDWVRVETQRRSVGVPELLEHLRTEVRKQALNGSQNGNQS